jgi:hypothetical protein
MSQTVACVEGKNKLALGSTFFEKCFKRYGLYGKNAKIFGNY